MFLDPIVSTLLHGNSRLFNFLVVVSMHSSSFVSMLFFLAFG